jgi:subtilisin
MVAASGYDYRGGHFQGIAPGVNLIGLRQNNQTGLANALKWVIANKAKYNIVAVNMTDYGGGGNKTTGNSIKASLNTLTAMNVYVTSPSGNGGSKYAAGSFGAGDVVVGSVNKGGGVSGFTQRGPSLNFLAPGEKVTVPYYDTGSKKHIYVDVADGTSWAAPQIAGAAALIRQVNPGFNNGQVTSILSDSAVQQYDSASKRSYPRLNLYNALKLAFQRAGKPAPAPGPRPHA